MALTWQACGHQVATEYQTQTEGVLRKMIEQCEPVIPGQWTHHNKQNVIREAYECVLINRSKSGQSRCIDGSVCKEDLKIP